GGGAAAREPALRLDFRGPLAVEALLNFLAARAIPGVEQVDMASATVTRSLRLQHRGAWLSGRIKVQLGAQSVLLTPSPGLWPAVASLVPLVRRWLDLDADPGAIDSCLGELAADLPGLRLPGATDRFELAVRAVLGQQVTVAAARTLARRLVERFGEALDDTDREVARLFPTPERLARAAQSEIAELGIISRRAAAIQAIAARWHTLQFAAGSGSVTEALAELQDLPGIGPWTAHYMLMRGWSWPDAWLPKDIVLLKHPRIAAGADPAQWQPYRSYAVLHLWRTS
ncbi:MAG TPA: AlkA N-terminal domain-containing protein, partial [Burkholderiaceae bacterium]